MNLQISEDESIILKCLVFDNYNQKRQRYEIPGLFMLLEDNHLFIISNDGIPLKVKRFRQLKDKRNVLKARHVARKKKPQEFEGLCIDVRVENLGSIYDGNTVVKAIKKKKGEK